MRKLKKGDYEPNTFKTGECESGIEGMKDGDLFWTVKMKVGGYNTKNQDVAEILSRLVRIEKLLIGLKKK